MMSSNVRTVDKWRMSELRESLYKYGVLIKLYVKILMYAAITAALIALIILVAKLI